MRHTKSVRYGTAAHSGVIVMMAEHQEGGNEGITTEANELTQAAARGDIDKVRDLLSQGVHPDAVNKYGRTALQTMNFAYPEIATILLDKGADPNVPDPDVGRTPLHDAVEYGTPRTVMCLLQGGADATVKERLFGNTPAHIAAEGGKEQMCQVLERCCSFRQRNQKDKTPYDLAVAHRHPRIAKKIAQFYQTDGIRLRHQCRLAIRRAAGPRRLHRLRELDPVVSPILTRYLMLQDEDGHQGS